VTHCSPDHTTQDLDLGFSPQIVEQILVTGKGKGKGKGKGGKQGGKGKGKGGRGWYKTGTGPSEAPRLGPARLRLLNV
jgi:hypothetical protein